MLKVMAIKILKYLAPWSGAMSHLCVHFTNVKGDFSGSPKRQKWTFEKLKRITKFLEVLFFLYTILSLPPFTLGKFCHPKKGKKSSFSSDPWDTAQIFSWLQCIMFRHCLIILHSPFFNFVIFLS